MLQRLAYRYHRFLGIMFLTIICTGLTKIDFSKINFSNSKTSLVLFKEDQLASLKKANAWINPKPLLPEELKEKIVLIQFVHIPASIRYAQWNWQYLGKIERQKLAFRTAAKFITSSQNLHQHFCCAFVAGKLFNHEY